jgi:NAD(P)-dependent dehydrogenase (short-subunit alcohol dehydrogenase family)
MLFERMLPWVGSFRDQVVLVTGASSGIGRETALSFARQGASVALAARRRDLLEEVAVAARDAGGRALVAPTDVSDPRSVRTTVSAVRRKWGRIDYLINNAGVLVPSTVTNLKAGDFESMLKVNLFGALFMMQAVIPTMQGQKHGSIINVASLAGRRGVAPLGGYCATKFALVGLTEALRTDPEAADIHVGLVLPGVVDTPMAHGLDQDAVLPMWPSTLNMPVEWVAAAVLLAARFRLREVSVPPGAATLEVLGALVPGISDTLIGWVEAAGRMITGRTARAEGSRVTRRGKTSRSARS